MSIQSKIFGLAIGLCAAFSIVSCGKDDSTDPSKGSVNFEITDAPFDDASVKGVFVTIVAVKVDGKAIEGFNKTTIDLAAYQRGSTKMLGSANLDAKTYSNVTLVLDNAADQNGTAPGCYVMTTSNTKKAIASTATTTEIALTGTFKSTANQSSTAVMDFDLRKTIAYDGTGGYKFASSSELTSGVRIVDKSQSGVIKGATTNSAVTSSDKIVVYAYKKGTYNKSTEIQAQGSSNIEFKNAVTSCAVVNDSYELHFLESGDYELHFISYKDKNADGKTDIQGEFQTSILGGLNLSALNLTLSATVTANVTLLAILP